MSIPTSVWLIYRAHRRTPKRVEMLHILSDGFAVQDLLKLNDLIRWSKVSDSIYNAYDEDWEYTCTKWQVDDSYAKDAAA